MAEQTAVDWLFEQIPVEWTSTKYGFDAYQQAKQMEKEQISDAWYDGECSGAYNIPIIQEYYDKTFGK
jgi:hypothetical protein